ncbi:hypothetical protein AGABI2DRAFT_181685 [Agaricus bisporus var. bisporus H97]|uniref:hypothetical protein n=1 Tax=Agaricus bisporus var. bisporus (strain H97 / ATCC MYA-4626 / FGSC 10389) TaxID=936046 RepID=UPI00029F51FE|nr:hypothetical protein AGABI2DRAFT_181685 [Agaricus bisporus var. bisporus H97]EKV41933.1 hypothetical protein AGABI2DRAFT_181685 [Agaricus bisporus var. bisporus H97]
MEAAWKEGNYTVAEYMSQMIMRKSLLKDHESGGVRPSNPLDWLRNAFKIADRVEEASAPELQNLRISLLRTIARAYFLDGAYDQAEAALDELIPSIDSVPGDQGSSEYQDLRWLRLAILKRRGAVDNSILDEKDITESVPSYVIVWQPLSRIFSSILQEVRTLTPFMLGASVNQLCLRRALQLHGTESNISSVDRLLLSLIFHCAKDDDHARAMSTLESTFTAVVEAEVELRSAPATACLTLLWQYGDRHYQAKKWPEAAGWFLSGTHHLFKGSSSAAISKCFRKAALCYIEHKEYAKASTVIRRCPTNEATTHYVMFLTAIHQGLDDEAIMHIRSMQKAPDFDRKMLLLATQVSHKLDMKPVLLSALEALLNTLKAAANSDAIVEAMTLIRCIIKMAMKLLSDPVANRPVLMDTVVSHFQTAKILTEKAIAQKSFAVVAKDVSWLWRTAYNCAVQGSSEWVDCEERIAELFDISRLLLEAYNNASPADMDPETALHIINASFAAVSARVFSARGIIASTGLIDREKMLSIAAEIDSSKSRIDAIINGNKVTEDIDSAHVQSLVHTLRVFETKFLVQLKEWNRVSAVVTEIVQSEPKAADAYEAIADILLDITIVVGQGLSCEWFLFLLKNSLDGSAVYVQSVSLGTPPTIGLLLLDTLNKRLRCWNIITKVISAALYDEARRWFEAATVICRYVPGGEERSEKDWTHGLLPRLVQISEVYTHLLARYRPDTSS